MIKMLTASTYELDNPEKAVQDILNQIDVTNGLLKNSVALLFCNSKFIETGIMGKICESLPFDILGCSSLCFCLSGRIDEFMLTITVLTSDDTEFSTGISESLVLEKVDDQLHTLYEETVSPLGGAPNLMFSFPPTIFTLSIDIMAAALDRASGGVPVFGTVALDMDSHVRSPQTIYKGQAYDDRMGILLFKGSVSPRFSFLRFPEKSTLGQDAVITGADGARLISINNKPAAFFLKEMGLLHDNEKGFSHAIPLIVEENDGSNPEVVVVQKIDSKGELICGRRISVGGILNIGAISADYVLESAKTLMREIKKNGDGAGLFIFSCFLRTVMLGEGAVTEAKIIQQELDDFPLPYLYLNSGGELCPRHLKTGETVNQVLQYAIVACQL